MPSTCSHLSQRLLKRCWGSHTHSSHTHTLLTHTHTPQALPKRLPKRLPRDKWHSGEKRRRGGYLLSIAVSRRELEASFDLIDGVTLQARQSRTLAARKRIDFEELKEVT